MLTVVHFTLAGMVRPRHGRMLQILVSLSSLHSGFLLVTRDETPIPQLREHGDHSVTCTGHFLFFTWFQASCEGKVENMNNYVHLVNFGIFNSENNTFFLVIQAVYTPSCILSPRRCLKPGSLSQSLNLTSESLLVRSRLFSCCWGPGWILALGRWRWGGGGGGCDDR